jgi:hypothetical protein
MTAIVLIFCGLFGLSIMVAGCLAMSAHTRPRYRCRACGKIVDEDGIPFTAEELRQAPKARVVETILCDPCKTTRARWIVKTVMGKSVTA